MSNEDVIKMTTDITLTDSNGQPINVQTQPPEYLTETFSWDGVERRSPKSQIITGEND